jgi:CYTH domain-containing protein
MAKEIEVKYLVDMKNFPMDIILGGKFSVQGYLSSDEKHATRINIRTRTIDGLTPETPITFKDVNCCMNIKGSRDMETRDEFEFQFPKRYACDILNMINERVMKIRFSTRIGWDVDMYLSNNAGLVVAEKEYPTIQDLRADTTPDWCIRNLTYDDHFCNRNLADTPFTELDNFDEIAKAIHGTREEMGRFVMFDVAPHENKFNQLLEGYARHISRISEDVRIA